MYEEVTEGWKSICMTCDDCTCQARQKHSSSSQCLLSQCGGCGGAEIEVVAAHKLDRGHPSTKPHDFGQSFG